MGWIRWAMIDKRHRCDSLPEERVRQDREAVTPGGRIPNPQAQGCRAKVKQPG
jgi:hypothetical protein